jgi:gamma-glutamyltranspeptidase/glutathione hydrolase
VRTAQRAGVDFEADDFAQYEAHLVEPVRAEVWGFEVVGGPPPTTGVSLYLPMLKALEPWSGESPQRTADAMNRIGQVWRQVQPEVARRIGDVPGAANAVAEMLSPESIERYRAAAGLEVEMELATTLEPDWTHDAQSTTHFVIVDAVGNAVSVTQSLSLHFGAGVMAPGTGVVMNDTLSNFAYVDESSPNIGAPGKRPRSTTSPTLVLREGRPVLAIGLPGGQRIPTAMFQVLWDHLGGGRSLVDAIGDRRWHLLNPLGDRVGKVWQIEAGLPEAVLQELRAEGWEVEEPEAPGTGHHFGGFTAIEILPDGTRRGLADTRRTNAAAGY